MLHKLPSLQRSKGKINEINFSFLEPSLSCQSAQGPWHPSETEKMHLSQPALKYSDVYCGFSAATPFMCGLLPTELSHTSKCSIKAVGLNLLTI